MGDSISYTNRDITAIRRELINKIPELTDKWKDLNESDIGMVYLEFLASVADMLNFYMDKESLEHSIYTAVQPKNIRSIVRSLGYRIPLMVPARWSVKVVFDRLLDRSITIPTNTMFLSSRGIPYLSSGEVVFLEGENEFEVPLIQGRVVSTGVKSGVLKSNRRYYLNNNGVGDKTLNIEQEDVIWEECDDALLEYNGGYFYSLHKDSRNDVYILFSPDWVDRLPENNEELVIIRYIETIGEEATIIGDVISRCDFIRDNGLKGYNFITEGTSYGGYSEEELDKIRLVAQENVKTMNRYITLNDYETAVRKVPYIRDCKVLDWKYKDYVMAPFEICVWAIDLVGNDLYDMKENCEEIVEDMNKKGICTNRVYIKKTNFVGVDIDVTVSIRGKRQNRDLVKQRIIERLEDFYSAKNWRYGKRLSISILRSEIFGVSDLISRVEIDNPIEDVSVSEIEFLKVNNINVNVIEDNNE